MLKRTVTLFQLLGFKVAIDWTWPFLALLIVWSLAKGVFPNAAPLSKPGASFKCVI